jgi:putative hydrolase of the HAD superfamily
MARARKTLKNLRARGTKLALLTKGDPELQKLRVEQSGLGDLFDLIEIVPEKSPRIIREVVQRMGLRTSDTWMVGNSMRSDILPAIEAGLHAVWIDAHVWEFERTRDAPTGYGFTTLPRLSDITALIAQ